MGDKQLNYKRDILRNLYFSESLSCAELSNQIDRSLPLTAKMLAELMVEGSVVETGHAPSTGGRRPLQYSLAADKMYIVSVAMDQFVTRIAILDMQNDYKAMEKFDLRLNQNKEAIHELIVRVEEVIGRSGIDREKIIGVGIGMPGFVDTVKGINYSFLESPQGPVDEYIQSKLQLPVYINNDSSLVALAELKFGAVRNHKSAMVVNIGWGIGLGMIINGELYQGQNGFAGELSHIPLFLNGKLCTCGKRGCLETESSLQVVLEKARQGLREGRESFVKELPEDNFEAAIESLFVAAAKGDQFMIGLLSDAGYTIGRGVAILIHLLNPELIILSGRGASPGIFWKTPIQQALNEHCIPRLSASTSIEISELGYNAEIIGAAALVMEGFYNN